MNTQQTINEYSYQEYINMHNANKITLDDLYCYVPEEVIKQSQLDSIEQHEQEIHDEMTEAHEFSAKDKANWCSVVNSR